MVFLVTKEHSSASSLKKPFKTPFKTPFKVPLKDPAQIILEEVTSEVEVIPNDEVVVVDDCGGSSYRQSCK